MVGTVFIGYHLLPFLWLETGSAWLDSGILSLLFIQQSHADLKYLLFSSELREQCLHPNQDQS